MPEIPASWVTLITLGFGAITGAISWAFIRQDAKLTASEGRNALLTDKVEKMLNDRIAELKVVADNAEKRRETDEKMARSVDMMASELAAVKLKVMQ